MRRRADRRERARPRGSRVRNGAGARREGPKKKKKTTPDARTPRTRGRPDAEEGARRASAIQDALRRAGARTQRRADPAGGKSVSTWRDGGAGRSGRRGVVGPHRPPPPAVPVTTRTIRTAVGGSRGDEHPSVGRRGRRLGQLPGRVPEEPVVGLGPLRRRHLHQRRRLLGRDQHEQNRGHRRVHHRRRHDRGGTTEAMLPSGRSTSPPVGSERGRRSTSPGRTRSRRSRTPPCRGSRRPERGSPCRPARRSYPPTGTRCPRTCVRGPRRSSPCRRSSRRGWSLRSPRSAPVWPRHREPGSRPRRRAARPASGRRRTRPDEEPGRGTAAEGEHSDQREQTFHE